MNETVDKTERRRKTIRISFEKEAVLSCSDKLSISGELSDLSMGGCFFEVDGNAARMEAFVKQIQSGRCSQPRIILGDKQSHLYEIVRISDTGFALHFLTDDLFDYLEEAL